MELKYQTSLATGLDLPANQDLDIAPGERTIVDTGIYLQDLFNQDDLIQLQKDFGSNIIIDAQIRPRSGLAAKHYITVLNTPGTIDLDYHDTIKVILINHGWKLFEIKKGDRIAQLVFGLAFRPTKFLTDGKRTGGFGSTG